MSTFQQRRCAHCSDRYSYQTSGGGWGDANHDGTYCPTCKAVILQALRAVLPRRVHEWVGTSDVTATDLEEQERVAWEETQAKGGLLARRIYPGLIDLDNPDNKHKQGIVRREGRTYKYEYWTLQGGVEAGHVFVEVERDLGSGEITGPWSLTDHWNTTPTFVDHAPFPPAPPPTHEFVPIPITSLRMDRSDLVERNQSLRSLYEDYNNAKGSPSTRNYDAKGRMEFSTETLPEGSLPIYDKDPDVTAYVVSSDKDKSG